MQPGANWYGANQGRRAMGDTTSHWRQQRHHVAAFRRAEGPLPVRYQAIIALFALLLAACASAAPTTGGSVTSTPTTSGTAAAGSGATATPIPGVSSWVSFMLATTQGRSNPLTIANVNPVSGKVVTVATLPATANVTVDGIAPNGALYAYHTTDSAGLATFTVAQVDGSNQKTVGQVQGVLGTAIWLPDNAHLAVGTPHGVVVIDTTTGSQTTASPIQAFLVAASPDGQVVFGTGTGSNAPQGALLRIPLGGTTFLALSARVTGGHFVFTADGKHAYYQNTGPAGQPGLYQIDTQTGANQQLRPTNDIPVGFSPQGALLTVRTTQPAGPAALIQLGANPTGDVIVANQLLPSGVSSINLAADIAVASDGTGLIIRGLQGTQGYQFYFLALTSSGAQPKLADTVANASRADLIGWDTILLPSGS